MSSFFSGNITLTVANQIYGPYGLGIDIEPTEVQYLWSRVARALRKRVRVRDCHMT